MGEMINNLIKEQKTDPSALEEQLLKEYPEFYKRIKPLKEYVKQHGSLNKICVKDIFMYHGGPYKIGITIMNLRQENRAGKLSKLKVEFLNSLGMVWEVKKNYSFETKIDIIKKFVKSGGCLSEVEETDVYKYDGEEYQIGRWVKYFRIDYLNHQLNEEKIKLLNNLGMIWPPQRLLSFKEKINILKAYLKENNTILQHVKVNTSYIFNNRKCYIGVWISKFRVAYNKGELSKEQICELEHLGINWRKQNGFEDKVEIIKTYIKKHGSLADIKTTQTFKYNGKIVNIGAIIHHFRQYYKNGKLTQQQINTLEELGIVWDWFTYSQTILSK